MEVAPGQRLSYQRHALRAEYWFIVSGTAEVTLNGHVCRLEAQTAIDVPQGCGHRIAMLEPRPLSSSKSSTAATSARTTSSASKTISAESADYPRSPVWRGTLTTAARLKALLTAARGGEDWP